MADDDRFYVKSLTLENFRCFEDVELGPFDPSFNLLVGENGAGKSSVLVALAGILVRYLDRIVETPDVVNTRDIREKQYNIENKWVGPLYLAECKILARVENRGMASNEECILRKRALPVATENHPSGDLIDGSGIGALVVFYRTSRKFDTRLVERASALEGQASQDAAYLNWYDAGRDCVRLREFMKVQTLLALQARQRDPNSTFAGLGSQATNYLSLLGEAVSNAFEEADSFEFDAAVDDIVVETKNGDRKQFLQMSDGQRALIGLIADLVLRISLLNGARLGKFALMETPGLVLIDEIDLHLHPRWQRQIVPALKKVFPKIQFFATTHSPQVIGECKPEEIVLLTPQGQKRPSGSFGRDSNWILERVMEAEGRDPKIAARLKDLFDAIEDEKFDEARVKIKELRADIGEGPDVVGAEAYLWRMEHLGDEAAE